MSIRFKILLLLGLVVALFALLDLVLFPMYYAKSARESLVERATAEAALLAEAVGPALEFEQLDSAQETLRVATADPLVRWAAIYDGSGGIMGRVGSGAPERVRTFGGPLDLPTERVAGATVAVERGDRVLGYVGVGLKTGQIQAEEASMRNQVLIQAVGVSIVGFLIVWYWSRSRLGRPLAQVTDSASRIASGDISGATTRGADSSADEVGALSRAFYTMSSRLRDLVLRISSTAESLAAAAAGMFSEVREQEALATQQTASLEEIRRTLETLSTAAEQVENDAQTVRHMAERNLNSSQQIAERTRLVSTHSERIGEILSLIQDIADRSDLLALNAALEGTKAGEVGRGFSLVAAEMRRLSEHVKDSVRDIRKLVADMREASHASVMATEEGIKLSRETSSAAVKITEAVVRQREGTSQVKSSADEIVRVVNESLRGRADTTSSAESLLKLSQDLKEAVSVFRLDAGDGRRDVDPA